MADFCTPLYNVALFADGGGGEVRVFFNQSPSTILGTPSRYRTLISAHSGIRGVARRPDVMVARRPAGSDVEKVIFIEVKDTINAQYTSDSIYKAMGYAHDYAALWESGPPCPKVVLLFPEAVSPHADADVSALEIVLLSSFDRQLLAKAMSSRLGLPMM